MNHCPCGDCKMVQKLLYKNNQPYDPTRQNIQEKEQELPSLLVS